MTHNPNLEGSLNSSLSFKEQTKKINEFMATGKITKPRAQQETQVDVKLVYCYGGDTIFESTLEISDDDGDLYAKLGNTDISNELPYGLIEKIIEDNQ